MKGIWAFFDAEREPAVGASRGAAIGLSTLELWEQGRFGPQTRRISPVTGR